MQLQLDEMISAQEQVRKLVTKELCRTLLDTEVGDVSPLQAIQSLNKLVQLATEVNALDAIHVLNGQIQQLRDKLRGTT